MVKSATAGRRREHFKMISPQLWLTDAGMSSNEAANKAKLFARCEQALNDVGEPRPSTSAEPTRLFVPGRLEFLGKHTDYAGGRSLVCAIERGLCAVVRPRADDRLRVIDAMKHTRDAARVFDDRLNDNANSDKPAVGWFNYARAVARRVTRNFTGSELTGADVAFASDLPAASGMSSSSTLLIAIFLAIDAANDLRNHPDYLSHIRSPEELAAYLATIENGNSFGALRGDDGVGTFGGSQDHTAILCGRPGMLSQYGFCPTVHERDVALPASLGIVIATSGVAAEKTGAAREKYNRASMLVSRLVQLWQLGTSRTEPTLGAIVRSSPDAAHRLAEIVGQEAPPVARQLRERLDQFVEESEQIILAAGDALLKGDPGSLRSLGALVARSQQLADHQLKNQVQETIDLVRCAAAEGAVAASAFGAGFGGSVWALVPRDDTGVFTSSWRRRYLALHPEHSRAAEFFVARPGPPATACRSD